MPDRPIDYGGYEDGCGVDYWELDPTIRATVERVYDEDALAWGRERLAEFGHLVGHTVAPNSDVVDEHGPELHTYDRDGNPANEVEYHPAHEESERAVYESGIVADVFRAPAGRSEPMPFSHNLAMQYLLCYADVGLDCPVAMTAGVAHVLERFDDGPLSAYLDGLTSRDYDDLVQGAMFLTEKQGGSDVGANETTARRAEDGTWRLTGEKWFCSNIDAQGTLALARPEGAPDGTAGLALFLVPHETTDGELNDQVYRRLKDKLGTVSVPTGEVEFRGAEAYLVGDEDAGFKQMAEMLNLERLSNAAAAMGVVGRALLESKIHAANREAFGKRLDAHPLMRADLVEMAVSHEAGLAFTFEAARQFDLREGRAVRGGAAADGATGDGTADDGVAADPDEAARLVRLLVPVAKYRTGRMAVDVASYATEIRGGDGYVADFVQQRLLRDAQVLPIWEGPSNVLALDVLRALDREAAHEPLLAAVQRRLDAVEHTALGDDVETVRRASHDLAESLATLAGADPEYAQLRAKRLADLVFDVFAAALLLERAEDRLTDEDDARMAAVARLFVTRAFRDLEARGITGGDRLPLATFDAVVRFAPLSLDDLDEAVGTAGD